MALLKNVVGIVSGGASGLGAATAAYIVRNGGRVVVADLASQHESFLRLAAASCAEAAVAAAADTTVSSPVLAFAETDVTNEDQVSAALDLAESQFGEPVNAAISCAGVGTAKKVLARPKEGDVMPRVHSLEEFSKTMQVNTVGTFNVARLAAQRMALREPDNEGLRGCIINTASIALASPLINFPFTSRLTISPSSSIRYIPVISSELSLLKILGSSKKKVAVPLLPVLERVTLISGIASSVTPLAN